MIFLNLSSRDYAFFSSIITKNTNLRSFFISYKKYIQEKNPEISNLFKLILNLEQSELIELDVPFCINPHINMLTHLETINGIRVFPVGDSLFSGNPKVGNGLSFHLSFVNDLIEVMEKKVFECLL